MVKLAREFLKGQRGARLATRGKSSQFEPSGFARLTIWSNASAVIRVGDVDADSERSRQRSRGYLRPEEFDHMVKT